MASFFDSTCPNFLCISEKFFHMPMGILKRKIRSWDSFIIVSNNRIIFINVYYNCIV